MHTGRSLFVSRILPILAIGSYLCSHAAPQSAANTGERTRQALHIVLGQSAVPLYGPWKFTVRDSPLDPVSNTPIWAKPDFDDSTCETVDLTPQSAAHNPITGMSGYVPGWTARGHAGYWGYAWYRIRVQVDSGQDVKLALAGPPEVDDSYQVFENGSLIGSFGDFSAHHPTVYYAQPMRPTPAKSATAPIILSHAFVICAWGIFSPAM